jgi:hypothetical protein
LRGSGSLSEVQAEKKVTPIMLVTFAWFSIQFWPELAHLTRPWLLCVTPLENKITPLACAATVAKIVPALQENVLESSDRGRKTFWKAFQ